MYIRILRIIATITSLNEGVGYWDVVCLCSDGIERIYSNFFSLTVPTRDEMQKQLDLSPSFFKPIE